MDRFGQGVVRRHLREEQHQGLHAERVKTMRVGILHLAQGAFAAIRNTATHSTEDVPSALDR